MKAIHLTATAIRRRTKVLRSFGATRAVCGRALVRMEYAPIAYSDLLLANGTTC